MNDTMSNLDRDINTVLRRYGIIAKGEISLQIDGEETMVKQEPWQTSAVVRKDTTATITVNVSIPGDWCEVNT